jgi:hypothetical protein
MQKGSDAPDHRFLLFQRPLQQLQQRQGALAEADVGPAAAALGLLGLRQIFRAPAGSVAPVLLDRRLDRAIASGSCSTVTMPLSLGSLPISCIMRLATSPNMMTSPEAGD